MVRSVLVNSDTPNYYSQIFYLIISHTEVVIITLLFLYKEKQYFIKTVIYSYIETNIKKRKIYSISTTKSVGEEIYIYIDTCRPRYMFQIMILPNISKSNHHICPLPRVVIIVRCGL